MKHTITSTASCLLAGLASLVTTARETNAAPPKLDALPIFKESVGKWKGTGASEIGFQRRKLEVTDEWSGEIQKDGSAFVQTGKVTLSNGQSFQYRWLYEVDPKTEKITALYTDSKRARSRHAVEVDAAEPKMVVTALDANGNPQKAGLFSTVYLKDGQHIYDAEMRDNMGNAVIKTTVTSVKEGEKANDSP